MTSIAQAQAQTRSGIATAVDGFVILDGPDGIALTLTAEAAMRTGLSLIDAAEEAAEQQNGTIPMS